MGKQVDLLVLFLILCTITDKILGNPSPREWNAGKRIDEHMKDEGFNNEIGTDRYLMLDFFLLSSFPKGVYCGVPQGLILGPIVLILINKSMST